jgi:hypothetical protein
LPIALCGRTSFSPCLVETEEPVGVQALGSKLAVQAFDERVVGRLSGPAEVERDTAHEGPQVELLVDELRPVVEPECFRAADLLPNPFEDVDDIGAAEVLPNLDRRRQVKVSTIVRNRTLRPSNSWSWTKSIVHTWLGAVAGGRSSRSCAMTRRLGAL